MPLVCLIHCYQFTEHAEPYCFKGALNKTTAQQLRLYFVNDGASFNEYQGVLCMNNFADNLVSKIKIINFLPLTLFI